MPRLARIGGRFAGVLPENAHVPIAEIVGEHEDDVGLGNLRACAGRGQRERARGAPCERELNLLDRHEQ